MPEINVFLFDFAHFLLLFKCKKDAEREFIDFEENNKAHMVQIRLNLFSDVNNAQKAFV